MSQPLVSGLFSSLFKLNTIISMNSFSYFLVNFVPVVDGEVLGVVAGVLLSVRILRSPDAGSRMVIASHLLPGMVDGVRRVVLVPCVIVVPVVIVVLEDDEDLVNCWLQVGVVALWFLGNIPHLAIGAAIVLDSHSIQLINIPLENFLGDPVSKFANHVFATVVELLSLVSIYSAL